MLNNELIEVMNTCLTNDYDSYTFTQFLPNQYCNAFMKCGNTLFPWPLFNILLTVSNFATTSQLTLIRVLVEY